MKQIFEVQTLSQVRRLAGAVMCETRDLEHQMATVAHSFFEVQVQLDMRQDCQKDVKKMLLKHERST